MLLLLNCNSEKNRDKISRLVDSLSAETRDDAPEDDGNLSSVVNRYLHYQQGSQIADFKGMITSMQFAVHIDR